MTPFLAGLMNGAAADFTGRGASYAVLDRIIHAPHPPLIDDAAARRAHRRLMRVSWLIAAGQLTALLLLLALIAATVLLVAHDHPAALPVGLTVPAATLVANLAAWRYVRSTPEPAPPIVRRRRQHPTSGDVHDR